MDSRTLYVRKDFTTVFVCPACDNTYNLDVSRGIKGIVSIEIKCSCGNDYELTVSRRRYCRKHVVLPGRFSLGDEKQDHPMTVELLSQGGLQFALHEKCDVKIGDVVIVELEFGENHIILKREAIVRNLVGRRIGVEFTSHEEQNIYERYCETALALYTIPKEKN